MDSSSWIAIYLPLLLVFITTLSGQKIIKVRMKNIKRKKGGQKMSCELIKNYIGKECNISLGSFSTNFSKVKIIEVIDNWMKIEEF